MKEKQKPHEEKTGFFPFFIKIITLLGSLITFVGFSFFFEKLQNNGNEYYKNELKMYVNELIRKDNSHNLLGIEIIEVKHDFGFNLLYSPATMIYQMIDKEYRENIIYPMSIFILLILTLTFSVMIEIIAFMLKININPSKYVIYILILYIITIMFVLIFVKPQKIMFNEILQEKRVVMIAKYNNLSFLNDKIKTINVIIGQPLNNYELTTSLSENYTIIHDTRLNCEILNFIMSKNGEIEQSILDNMTYVNKIIKVEISKSSNQYMAEVYINNHLIKLNNLYLKNKDEKLYFSDILTDKTDLYLKCEDGKYSLYFRDLLIKENKHQSKIENLIKYLDENLRSIE